MPSRVNNISVVAGTAPATVRLYISMVDRFGVYEYYDAFSPIRSVDAYRFPGGGQFFHSIISSSGTVFTAAGNAGVIAFSPSGKVLAQLRTSGEVISTWVPGIAYGLGSLIQPRSVHPFSPNRYYFKATTGGTSGNGEPAWSTTTTVSDGSVVWTPQGPIDGVVTDVALIESTKRLYAVGSAGGNLGTDGRLWALNVGGLI